MHAESNITQVMARVKERFQNLQSEYTVVLANTAVYAAAIEYGWTREYIWAQMPPAQRFAIIKAMERRGNKAKSPRATVTQIPGGWRIKVAPAAMVGKSIPIVKKHMLDTMFMLTGGMSDRSMRAWLLDAAIFAHASVSTLTPVDHGFLAGQWQEPRLI